MPTKKDLERSLNELTEQLKVKDEAIEEIQGKLDEARLRIVELEDTVSGFIGETEEWIEKNSILEDKLSGLEDKLSVAEFMNGDKPKTVADTTGPDLSMGEFKNMYPGLFDISGIYFNTNQTQPVPDEIQKQKRFKHAVKLGLLVKV